jgi:uncharacterized protein YrzB (UPF0473 family)
MTTPKKALIYIQVISNGVFIHRDADLLQGNVSYKVILKNAMIFNIDSPDFNEKNRLVTLTEKGYKSQKNIEINFITMDRLQEGGGGWFVELTDSEFDYIKETYCNNSFKTFESPQMKASRESRLSQSSRDLAWCSVMKDPYDIG